MKSGSASNVVMSLGFRWSLWSKWRSAGKLAVLDAPPFLSDLIKRPSSPYINRFLQPDSIIPSPAYPQSLNRYTYVLNNPINANDPSGHQCNGEPEECLDNDGDPINGADWSYGGDLSTSSDPSMPSTIDSEDPAVLSLYNIYFEMWGNRDGWWWDQYGSGGFTIWEFMAVMWGYEQQGFPNTTNYAAALSNHGSWWCGNSGCDIHTAAGSLKFMMEFGDVIPDRVDCLADGTCTYDSAFYQPPTYWADDRMLIVQGIKDGAFSNDPAALFDVGNVSLRSKIFKKMARLGMIHTIWGQKGEDPMIILTYCQWQVMDYALNNDGAASINMRLYRSYCGGNK